MLSGNSARGRSSAPGSGKIGMMAGRSSGQRYLQLPAFINQASREEHRGQPAPSSKRRLVHRTPGLEELEKLLAGAFFVPITVAAHDFKEMVRSRLTIAARIEEQSEVEAGLMIGRIGRKPC